jgi:outer membrane lipoprotein-sorting protein
MCEAIMKTTATLSLAAALLLSLAAPVFAQSAQEIVAASDRVRNPGEPFRLTNVVTEYTDGKPVNRTTLIIVSKEDAKTHQYSTVVRYTDPPRDTGKMVLMDGTKMWFYDPASKASVRLSPQQRLLGQASSGDVVSVNFARDYTGTTVGEEKIQDADRKDRSCWHLDLKPSTEDAVYGRVEYWIEKDTHYPVKSKFYTDSGRLLKLAYYRKMEQQLGGMRPTEAIIVDAVDSKQVTKMSYSDYRRQDVPDAWFQRDALPRLTFD